MEAACHGRIRLVDRLKAPLFMHLGRMEGFLKLEIAILGIISILAHCYFRHLN